MKVSIFWHYIEEVDLFWNSLNFSWLNATQEIKDIFKKRPTVDLDLISQTTKDVLITQKFLVLENNDKALIDGFIQKKKECEIKSLYLIMSTKCNLACSYCLYKPNQSHSLKKRKKNLSEKEIFKALHLFVSKTQKNNHLAPDYWEQITFYGGEPLMNLSGIKYGVGLINQIKKDGNLWKDLRVIVDTNGTLINDEFIDFSKKNQINVQVSIDGPMRIHDLSRKFKNGNGSFGKVFSSMKKMSEKKLAFLPLITISPSNIDVLPECVEWLCQNFEISEVVMNILMYTDGDVKFPYGHLAADAMVEAHNIAKRFGVNDPVLSSVLKRFSSPSVSSEVCGAGAKIAAFPGGDLHACQALEDCGVGFLGKVTDFDDMCDVWQTWKRRSRFSNNNCLTCPVLGFCGGGCAASAFVASGDLDDVDPYYCGWMKRLFDLWIKEKKK